MIKVKKKEIQKTILKLYLIFKENKVLGEFDLKIQFHKLKVQEIHQKAKT